MDALIALIARIPGTFWGVLAGSIFSLGGVWLTNSTAARNLKSQHEHDRTMRNRERKMALRRDIYLAAAEALAAGFYTIGRFGDLKIDGDSLTAPYVEKSPALAKVNIVATIQTLRAITDVEGELNATFMRLHKERIRGMQARRDLVIVSKGLDGYLRMQTTAVEALSEENLKGRPDQIRWQGVNNNFDFASQQIKSQLVKQQGLELFIQAEQLRVANVVSAELVKVTKKMVPLISAVRHELDMSIDEVLLEQLVVGVAERASAGMKDFIAQLKIEFEALRVERE